MGKRFKLVSILGNDAVGRPIIIENIAPINLPSVLNRLSRRLADGTVTWFASYVPGDPVGIVLADEMWRQHSAAVKTRSKA